jgi:hypothetical protein
MEGRSKRPEKALRTSFVVEQASGGQNEIQTNKRSLPRRSRAQVRPVRSWAIEVSQSFERRSPGDELNSCIRTAQSQHLPARFTQARKCLALPPGGYRFVLLRPQENRQEVPNPSQSPDSVSRAGVASRTPRKAQGATLSRGFSYPNAHLISRCTGKVERKVFTD